MILFIVVALLLLAAVSPRRVWWALSAWQYRNPEANEPSDALYAGKRFGCIVLAIVFGVLGFNALGKDDDQRDQERSSQCFDTLMVVRLPLTLMPANVDTSAVHRDVEQRAHERGVEIEQIGELSYRVRQDGEVLGTISPDSAVDESNCDDLG